MGAYTFDMPSSPRLGIELDHASGDEDPADNERNTFDNLYPTNHIHYGFMDRASLQNLNNVRLTGNIRPLSKLSLQCDIHVISLDETTDSLYHAGRKPIRTSAAPGISTAVGTDFDVLARYSLNENVKLLAGYSHFITGEYLQNTGSDDDGDFFYFQTMFSF